MSRQRLVTGIAALLVGCAVNHFGDRLLGVQIELFRGLDTFSFLWILDMFALPFLVGLLVAVIFGLGGKWLCYFPPLIVRSINYYALAHSGFSSPDASLLPLGWWGFFVILAIEAAAVGGIIGEVVMKGTYGRSAPGAVYKQRAEDGEGDS
jgi:hypothetical protein